MSASHAKCSQAHAASSPAVLARLGGAPLAPTPPPPCASPRASTLRSARRQIVRAQLEPSVSSVSVSAPATVANLGPGFDWLGCALEGKGDTVHARVLEDHQGLVIESIEGDQGRLSKVPEENCVGIAALETLKLLGLVGTEGEWQLPVGIGLSLNKGLPLGSGLGSSAASAAAGCESINALFGSPLSSKRLVDAGIMAEAAVSGYHADNIAPALMGGFVVCRAYEPALDLFSLQFPKDKELWFTVVTPEWEVKTKDARAVLPKDISMKQHIHNCSQGASLVAAICTGDVPLLGSALSADCIVEPARAPLIPGFSEVKVAAQEAGATGCTISGAGPTCVALCESREAGEAVAVAMEKTFKDAGNLECASIQVSQLDQQGSRIV